MPKKPELIVMLTWHDYTVENAHQVFEQCKDAQASYWGMKELPLPMEQMQQLYAYMKSCGKTTILEVVAYTEEEGLAGARRLWLVVVIFLWVPSMPTLSMTIARLTA